LALEVLALLQTQEQARLLAVVILFYLQHLLRLLQETLLL